MSQDGVVSGGMSAEDDLGSWGSFDAEGMGANRDAAIGADLDLGEQAPNKGPPGAVGFGAQQGAFFFAGQVPGFLRGHVEFAVDFVLVVMEAQGLDLGIGLIQFGDVLAGEEGG